MRWIATIGVILLLAAPAWGQGRRRARQKPAADISAGKEMEWEIDGERRTALVFLPESQRTIPAPVVLWFHGSGGRVRGEARNHDFQTLWPEAIVAYLQGLPTPLDKDGKGGTQWHTAVGLEQYLKRDLKFVDAVLKTLRTTHPVDDDRIYATGFSSGACFTYVLWVARPRVFAAYAPCAGTLAEHPRGMTPAPVMHICGENDRNSSVPFEKQLKTMATVRQINGCQKEPVDWATDADLPPGAKCQLYQPRSPAGAPFVSVIHKHGHVFPRRAAALIVRFFKEHPRKR